jgi:hypothetical protein
MTNIRSRMNLDEDDCINRHINCKIMCNNSRLINLFISFIIFSLKKEKSGQYLLNLYYFSICAYIFYLTLSFHNRVIR